jgi:cytochrome c oxidase subunit 4
MSSEHAHHGHWTDVSEHKGFHPHILPLKVYMGVFAALMVLTVATVALYRIDPGHLANSLGISANLIRPINMILSMIIATTKATLVAMIFMHLFFDNKLYMLLFLGSLLFLTVFIVVTMFDTLRRGDIYDYRAVGPEIQIEYPNIPAHDAHGADAGHGPDAGHDPAAPATHDTAAPATHDTAAPDEPDEAVPATHDEPATH